MGYTCETAEYFQLFHVTSRIERFEAELEQRKATAAAAAAAAAGGAEAPSDGGAVKELFPFRNFFSNAPAGERLFEGKHLEKDLDTARGCFRHIGRVRSGLILSPAVLFGLFLGVFCSTKKKKRSGLSLEKCGVLLLLFIVQGSRGVFIWGCYGRCFPAIVFLFKVIVHNVCCCFEFGNTHIVYIRFFSFSFSSLPSIKVFLFV